MIHHNKCPLCFSASIKPFQKCTDHFLSKEVFEVYRCNECSFTFTQDYPEENKIGRYYDSDEYISHSGSSVSILEKGFHLAKEIMLKRKKRIVEKASGLSGGSVLDIGSGTGHFVNTMKKAGWKTMGIEINKKARDYASARFNIDLMEPGRLESLNDCSFDCITLWHALEHFHEPFIYLYEIRRLLKPDGIVLVALPNNNSYDAEYYRSDWAAYDVPRHLWHFNPSTFKLFTEKSNFKNTTSFCLPFDVFYISILSERYKGSKFAMSSGFFIGLLFSIRSFINNSKSSSVIYTIRKQSD